MRELKLKYFIDLVSNLGPKAKADAKAMEEAQAVLNNAITGTNNKFLDYNKLALLAGKNTSTMQEVLTGATNKFAALDRAISQAGSNTSLERQTNYLRALESAAAAAGERMQALRRATASALDKAPDLIAKTAVGGYAAERVLAAPIKAYASLEEATTDLKVALMHKGGSVDKNFEAISKVAVDLGAKLPGSTKDYMGAATALAEQGVSPTAIANGALTSAANMGVLLKMDRGQAAETVAKIREAYSLKDDELPGLADTVQRNKFAFGLSPEGIRLASAYSGSTLSMLGLSGAENLGRILTVEGISAQNGLGDSQFGTNFGMMLTQLQSGPAAIAAARRGMKGRAREVMDKYGINFDFFDASGALKQRNGDPIAGVIHELTQINRIPESDKESRLEIMKAVFGQEGMRPAAILAKVGDQGYDAARARVADQASLDERIAAASETLAWKFEALGGTVENFQAAMAKQLSNGALKPLADKANDVAGDLQAFVERHPAAGSIGLGLETAGGVWAAIKSYGIGRAILARIAGGAAAEGAAGAGAAAAAEGTAATAGGGLLGGSALATGGLSLAGLFTASQLWRVGSAFSDLHEIQNREGVKLSPYAQSRLQQINSAAAARALGTGLPDIDSLIAGGTAGVGGMPSLSGQPQIQLGEGKLSVDVHVLDDRVSVSTSVPKQMSLVRIDGGATNPAGYRMMR